MRNTRNHPWYLEFRALRVRERERLAGLAVVSHVTLTRVLKELYDFIYTEEQQIFTNLVNRYKNKIPRKNLALKLMKIRRWRPEARKRAISQLSSLVYSSNPFLDLLKNKEGHYIPVAYTFNKEEE